MRRKIAIIVIPAAFCAAAFAIGDSTPNAEVALARAREKGRQMLAQLPNYTCREAVQRFVRHSSGPWVKQDALTLEVARVGDRELFAAPGRGFDVADPARIAGGGTIASGSFTGHLTTLFAGDSAKITFRGRADLDNHAALRYDFTIPPEAGWTLTDGTKSAQPGEKGSFWVDAKSFDLLRLVVKADRVPSNLLITGAMQRIDYAETRIGDRDELLPREAELIVSQRASGEGLGAHDGLTLQQVETRNLVSFSGCRAYQAESQISFGPQPQIEIPGGMSFETRMETDIDSNRVAVGEGMVAKVENAIRKGGKIIVPAGALLKGRISTVEQSDQPGSLVVGAEFSEVEFGGQRAQFAGQLKTVEPGAAADVVVAPQQDRPGAVTFRMPGAGVSLKGLRMSWRTLDSSSR